jgi:quercetin dioxygenase-like cupin family protein
LITPQALTERHIPFTSLRSSTEAFIDYCLPECTPKFNYALIGPGVSQSASQPVNLREPHGFQVGGVSLPHGKVNPPHMHFTCEVFICTRGNWRIQWGFNPEVSHADIGEGDIVSVPTWVYRGFTNIGADNGFMFTALGGDRTGGVLWGPATIEAARSRGVQLTAAHRIFDTNRGDTLAPGETLFQPMSAAEIAALRVWPHEAMAQRIVRWGDLAWSRHGLLDSALPGCGAQLAAAVGLGLTEDRNLQAPVANPHGLSIEWLRIPAGGRVSRHRTDEKVVLIARHGRVDAMVETSAGAVPLPLAGGSQGWDTVSLPAGHWRSIVNPGSEEAVLLVMAAGDARKRITWCDSVAQAAAAAGWVHDANGFVAERRFVERAQP